MNLNDECGLCLDSFKDRNTVTFPCLNHFIHEDCYKLWKESENKKNENDKTLCIFRCSKKDVATFKN